MSDDRPVVLNTDGKLYFENADGTLSPTPEGWTLRPLFCNPHSVEAMWSKLAIRHHHGERGFRPVRGFAQIAHLGRELLGRDLEDEELIRRVRDWYVAEHGGSHESFLRMHCTKLADLLRESVNPRKDDAGKPERGDDSQPERDVLYHAADETPPDEYPHGPLTGSKTDLAGWITGKRDPRRLPPLVKSGVIRINSLSPRRVEVRFREQLRYAEANQRRIEAEQKNANGH